MARIAIIMIGQFSINGGDAVKDRIVAIPGLLSSMVNLCGEETLLGTSKALVVSISGATYWLSEGSPARAAALVEAGWACLLIRTLRTKLYSDLYIKYTSCAIHSLLLYCPAKYRVSSLPKQLWKRLWRDIPLNWVEGKLHYCFGYNKWRSARPVVIKLS